MKVYITGIHGFIGKALFEKLSSRYDIVGITRGQNHIEGNIIFFDYKDDQWLHDHVSRDCVVIHTAALLPAKDNEACIYHENRSIDACVMKAFEGPGNVRFMFFSSISVYGYNYIELDHVTETSPVVIKNEYSRSKLEGERAVAACFEDHIILRLSSPYGKNKTSPSILDSIVAKARNNEDIVLYGEGKRTQDFVHIDDIVTAVDRLIQKREAGGIYNLACGQCISMREAAQNIIKFARSASRIISIDREESPSVSVNNAKIAVEADMQFDSFIMGMMKDMEWKDDGITG